MNLCKVLVICGLSMLFSLISEANNLTTTAQVSSKVNPDTVTRIIDQKLGWNNYLAGKKYYSNYQGYGDVITFKLPQKSHITKLVFIVKSPLTVNTYKQPDFFEVQFKDNNNKIIKISRQAPASQWQSMKKYDSDSNVFEIDVDITSDELEVAFISKGGTWSQLDEIEILTGSTPQKQAIKATDSSLTATAKITSEKNSDKIERIRDKKVGYNSVLTGSKYYKDCAGWGDRLVFSWDKPVNIGEIVFYQKSPLSIKSYVGVNAFKVMAKDKSGKFTIPVILINKKLSSKALDKFGDKVDAFAFTHLNVETDAIEVTFVAQGNSWSQLDEIEIISK